MLLLDEPAGGLDSSESQWLGLRLRKVRDRGVSILLIDHDMHLVLNLCDSIYVLDFGRIIAQGPPSRIKTDRAVAAAYLGSTHAEVLSLIRETNGHGLLPSSTSRTPAPRSSVTASRPATARSPSSPCST